ncbi:MAG: kinase-like domain-containing protein [Monoraphidium minutum]|nr:MAG: kinase-like domain-containing protein [Monoraphidium minutum]
MARQLGLAASAGLLATPTAGDGGAPAATAAPAPAAAASALARAEQRPEPAGICESLRSLAGGRFAARHAQLLPRFALPGLPPQAAALAGGALQYLWAQRAGTSGSCVDDTGSCCDSSAGTESGAAAAAAPAAAPGFAAESAGLARWFPDAMKEVSQCHEMAVVWRAGTHDALTGGGGGGGGGGFTLYFVGAELGAGGYGCVRRAVRLLGGVDGPIRGLKLCAIKMAHTGAAAADAAARRLQRGGADGIAHQAGRMFVQEAAAYELLRRHRVPNIAEVHEFGAAWRLRLSDHSAADLTAGVLRPQEGLLLSMKRYTGSLADACDALSPATSRDQRRHLARAAAAGALRAYGGMALAAAALRAQGRDAASIPHRDVKPDNMLVDSRGEVFVSDHGLTRVVCGAEPPCTFIGGSVFFAPEVRDRTFARDAPGWARDLEVGPKTDIWSVGVIVYNILSGNVLERELSALTCLGAFDAHAAAAAALEAAAAAGSAAGRRAALEALYESCDYAGRPVPPSLIELEDDEAEFLRAALCVAPPLRAAAAELLLMPFCLGGGPA